MTTWMAPAGDRGLVSIIVPTHNRAELLAQTINSIQSQTYSPIEVVIVDDGSSDNTAEAVQRNTRGGSPRIQWQHLRQTNQGACAARNCGLESSRGEFIQFLDSDDGLMPAKLARQVAVMRQRPALDMVYCLTAYDHYLNGKPTGQVDVSGEHPRDLLAGFVRHSQFPVHAPLWRRAICRAAGPWATELRSSQDWEYGVRCLLHVRRWEFMNAVLAWARREKKGSIGGQADRLQRENGVLARRLIIENVRRGQPRPNWQLNQTLLLATLSQACECHATGHPDLGEELVREVRCLLGSPIQWLAAQWFLRAGTALGWRNLNRCRRWLVRGYERLYYERGEPNPLSAAVDNR